MKRIIASSIFGILLLVSAIVLSFVVGVTPYAKANPSAFSPATCYTASATTSVAYITPTATSTVACNFGPEGVSTATLAVQVNASSTQSKFTFIVEESMDGVDWYPINNIGQANASKAPQVNFDRGSVTFTFASSTSGFGNIVSTSVLGLNGTPNRTHFVFDIPVRLRQVRVHSVMAPGSLNGATWVHIVPRQQY